MAAEVPARDSQARACAGSFPAVATTGRGFSSFSPSRPFRLTKPRPVKAAPSTDSHASVSTGSE